MKSLKKLHQYDNSEIQWTTYMLLGIAAHVYFLEGKDEFHRQYQMYDSSVDKRTKSYKSLKTTAQSEGKKLISDSDYNNIKEMHQNLMNHPMGCVLDQSEKEVVAIWDHIESGVQCKSKIDILGSDFIADIKFTSKEIDPINDYMLFKTIYERAYYRQLVFYKEPFNHIRNLYLIFIEFEPPHEITWVDIMDDENWVKLAQMEIDVALARYNDFNQWINGNNSISAGYPKEKRQINCPQWAIDRVSNLYNKLNLF